MAKTKKKTGEERILAYLSRRKTPATVFDAMHAAELNESSARNALLRLRKKGAVALVGREIQHGVGRPANLYRAA